MSEVVAYSLGHRESCALLLLRSFVSGSSVFASAHTPTRELSAVKRALAQRKWLWGIRPLGHSFTWAISLSPAPRGHGHLPLGR